MKEIKVTRDDDGKTVLTCLACGETREVQHTYYRPTAAITDNAFGLPAPFGLGIQVEGMLRQSESHHE